MSYKKLVGEDTFIGQYLHYMEDLETSIEYDFWSAIWLMSLACKRHLIIDRPHIPVYMNTYIILVAESGITRKSTAIRIATKVANDLLASDPAMGILEGKITPEKLDAYLHDRTTKAGSSQVAISISELAVFLGNERYTAAMPALLTDLYDCPETRKVGGSLSRGSFTQERIYVSFISASTPTWLHQSVNPNIVAGGFTSRCLFVVSEQPKRRIAWPDPNSRGNTECFTAQLKQISERSRELKRITINEGGLRSFQQWYTKRTLNVDPFRSSFESREDDHVLRLAGFLCINDGMWVIQSGHIKQAIRLVDGVKRNSCSLFEGTHSRSKWLLGITRMRETLIAGGVEPISRSKLFLSTRNYLDNHEFQSALDVMHELGAVQLFEVKQDGAGRPTTLIRATKALIAKNFVAAMVGKMV